VDLNTQLNITERRGLDAMAEFVMIELEFGRTLCKVAANYKNNESSNAAIARARKALEAAEKYMWNLRMEHTVFDEMTARAERLRLELEALDRS
jgi:hypothetical protein